mmetsp:Transcript_5118/g.12809  ORF Transcript_5118/g.12809 Transcript_5118/m.12809 type:complete len:229 (+) Transcript_5118:806-1492(+)
MGTELGHRGGAQTFREWGIVDTTFVVQQQRGRLVLECACKCGGSHTIALHRIDRQRERGWHLFRGGLCTHTEDVCIGSEETCTGASICILKLGPAAVLLVGLNTDHAILLNDNILHGGVVMKLHIVLFTTDSFHFFDKQGRIHAHILRIVDGARKSFSWQTAISQVRMSSIELIGLEHLEWDFVFDRTDTRVLQSRHQRLMIAIDLQRSLSNGDSHLLFFDQTQKEAM